MNWHSWFTVLCGMGTGILLASVVYRSMFWARVALVVLAIGIPAYLLSML